MLSMGIPRRDLGSETGVLHTMDLLPETGVPSKKDLGPETRVPHCEWTETRKNMTFPHPLEMYTYLQLFSGLLWTIILMEVHKKVSLRSSFCKLLFFLYGLFTYSSSATLSIMSAEKFVALYFPLQAKKICNVRIAKRVILIVAFLSAVINFYLFIVVKVGTDHFGFEECTAAYNGMLVMMYLEFIFYSFGPFLLMCVVNVLIIYKLLMLRYKNQNNQTINQGTNKSAMRGVGMLVSVSLTFIILTTPIGLVFLI